jgi:succinate dehydrogenase/fumarate reductase flavoprotein subunit
MNDVAVLTTDVLVVGSEGAGSFAALEAADAGADVLLLTKDLHGRGGVTVMAAYSCAAATGDVDPEDTPDIHFRDTITGGYYLPNQELVQLCCDVGVESVRKLDQWGCPWDKTPDGRFHQTKMPGYTYRRALHCGHATGIEVMKTLVRQVRRNPHIRVLNETVLTDLLVRDGQVTGAMAIHIPTGEFLVLRAKFVILATGSALALYALHSGAAGSTGDGTAIALRAGAELVDIEFTQFFPTSAIEPRMRGWEGVAFFRYFMDAWLLNRLGERFMARYDPQRMELATRDVLARAIISEVRAGRGGPHGGVYLDVSHIPARIIEEEVKARFNGWTIGPINPIIDYGWDPRTEPAEIAPTCHFFCGGIRINKECHTNVPGLLAAGEAAGGFNGANRLAGNALSQVFALGLQAGRMAARRLRQTDLLEVKATDAAAAAKRWRGLLKTGPGVSPSKLRRELQRLMSDHVGLVRSKASLEHGITEIQRLRDEIGHVSLATSVPKRNYQWLEAISLVNMLDVAGAIAEAALSRNESRGTHYRIDFPDLDDEKWLANIVISHKDGTFQLTPAPLTTPKMTLAEMRRLGAPAALRE